MNKNFCHLHTHNEYSILDGFGKASDYAARAKELGFEYLALTNHGNVDGLLNFQIACEENKIKPIFGCEAYLVEDMSIKEKDEKRTHITLLVKNKTGWKNLLKILTIANMEGFYYRPRIDPGILLDHCDGLIIMTACSSSFLMTDWGIDLFHTLREKIKDDLYLEIMPFELKEQYELNKFIFQLHKEYKTKLVATNDCHYIFEHQSESQEVLLAIQSKKKWKDPKRWKFSVTGLYLKTAEEMEQAFKEQGIFETAYYKKAIKNSVEVAKKCENFKIENIPVDLPKPPCLKGEDDIDSFNRLCAEGYKNKILKNKKKNLKEYKERYEFETTQIIKQGFCRYFLIVWELIDWCKKSDIMVGPGRGSSGGSLVCYLMGITNVDPIKFGLLFARFISPARIDFPDIDMDFEDTKRYMIREHLEELYGKHNVVGVSTFGRMKGKSAIRDVSRVFDVPLVEVGKACDCIVVRSGGDERSNYSISDAFSSFEDGIKFKEKYGKVTEIAEELEGQIRNKGQHAAAMCISTEDFRTGERASLQFGKDKDIMVGWEKYDIEHFGIMKLDVLGLKALSVLNNTRKLVKENSGIDIDFENLSFEDDKCYEEFSKGNTIGCFQVGSTGLMKYCRQLGIENFEMLAHATSLYRPGTLRCLTGDTEIKLWSGKKIRIDEIDIGRPVKSSMLPEYKSHTYIKNNVEYISKSGIKDVYLILTKDGDEIKATKKHKFFTKKKRPSKYKNIKGLFYEEAVWCELKNIEPGDKLLMNHKQVSNKQKSNTKKLAEAGKDTRFKKNHNFWDTHTRKKTDYSYNHYKQSKKKVEESKKNWKKKMFSDIDKWNKTIEKMRKTINKRWENKENRKKQSEIMLKYYSENEHPNSKGINVSKPQLKIFEEVKKIFKNSELEYRYNYIDCEDRKRFFNLDVAIPEMKLNIEFDGEYWHKNPGERHEPRDSILESDGWKVLRITYQNIKKFPELLSEFVEDNSVKYCEVIKIKYAGREKTYDLMMKNQECPNYIANNFIVHNSGTANDFVDRKRGKEWEAIHPMIDELTKDTYGVILYQEQVMNFMYNLAGLGWRTCDTVRKVISKSQGDELFRSFKKQFAEGCVEKKTLDIETAEFLWDQLASFGSYSFCKSHAVEYSMITFWDMYCKVYHPAEFICASLTYGSETYKDDLIREAFRLGLDLRPPKLGKSKARTWTVIDNILYVPFVEIKGFGEKTVEKAEDYFNSKEGFFDKKPKLTKKYLSILEELKASEDIPITNEFADKIRNYFSFSLFRDNTWKMKKIQEKIKLKFNKLKNINFEKNTKGKKYFFVDITKIKFSYKSEKSGGMVYGYVDDKSDSCMIIFNKDLYKRRKDEIEHAEGKSAIIEINSYNKNFSAINCSNIWFEDDIYSLELDGIDFELVEKRRFRNKEVENCKECSLFEECKSPVPSSKGIYNIMVVGESPGRDDDRNREILTGAVGNLIWKEFEKYGFFKRQFNVTSIVKCHPSKSKTPNKRQIKKCSKWIDEEIENIKPSIILAFGNTSLKYFLDQDSGIMTKSGTTEWIDELGTWICWCTHPASVLYHDENREMFKKGIDNFCKKIKKFLQKS